MLFRSSSMKVQRLFLSPWNSMGDELSDQTLKCERVVEKKKCPFVLVLNL